MALWLLSILLHIVMRIPFGTSKLTHNEALHSRSSVPESLDEFDEGRTRAKIFRSLLSTFSSRVLWHLDTQTGAEDEQFEEEKELIIKEIDKLSRLSNLDPRTFILNGHFLFLL